MIELRDLLDEDEALLFQWRSEPEVDRWMSDADLPSREAHAAWFRALKLDPDMRGWMITRGGVPMGLLTLTGLTSHHRRASWNWFLGSARDRELEDTVEIFARAKAVLADSIFATDEQVHEFIVGLIFDICERRGVTPSLPLGRALYGNLPISRAC